MSASYMQPLRIMIQTAFVLFMIWLGISFYQFVQAISSCTKSGSFIRPDGIDGFIPISGFLGTVSWIHSGEINQIHPAAVIIFVTVLLVSFLLRRSFCSWICPVAFVSECAWKSGYRLLRRNWSLPVWLDILLRCVKYLLMLLLIYFTAFAMTPDALLTFIQSDYHMVSDVHLMNFFIHISSLSLVVIVLLVLLSVVLRNPFCRYLCPYGALLGLVALLSPLRVTRDQERCVSCGACNQACPNNIDVMHKSSVASPECVACWRCISHCRFNNALTMRLFNRLAIPGIIFAFFVVLLFWSGSVIGKLSGNWHSFISLKEYVRLLGK